MGLKERLDELEDKYFGEFEENRESVLPELQQLYGDTIRAGQEQRDEFEDEVWERMGGVFLPYLFWYELSTFDPEKSERKGIQRILRAFANSSFEDEEKKKFKPLLITYFAMEKEFEVDRLKTKVIDHTHKTVQEWFVGLMNFREKNRTSADMYIEKFSLLKSYIPDFELFNLPVTKLKERLAEV